MIRSLPFLAIFVPVLLLAGCEGGSSASRWEKDQLESQTAKDIDNFLAEFDDLGGGISEASSARDEDALWEACVVGYAGCRRCYSVGGTAEAGTVDMEHVLGDEVEECAASVTLNGVFYGYTIHEWWWSGTWTALSDGKFDVAWNGASASTLVIEGSNNNDGTYDFDYTMNAASAVTDGEGNLDSWSVRYEYNGFLGRDWQVDCAKDAEGVISGTITGDGATCVISGQGYDYVVDCQ